MFSKIAISSFILPRLQTAKASRDRASERRGKPSATTASTAMVRFKNRYLFVHVHCDPVNASYLRQKLCPHAGSSTSTGGGAARGVASGDADKGKAGAGTSTSGPLGIGVPALSSALGKIIASSFGSCDSGSILSSLQVRAVPDSPVVDGGATEKGNDDEGGLKLCLVCVVRCDRDYCRQVRAAIFFLTDLLGVRVALTTVKVKGSTRTMAEEITRHHRAGDKGEGGGVGSSDSPSV